MAKAAATAPGEGYRGRMARAARLARAVEGLPAGEPQLELVAAIAAAVRGYFEAGELEAADALVDLLPEPTAKALLWEYLPLVAAVRYGR